MKPNKLAIAAGLAIVTAATAAFALPGNRYLVYSDPDFSYCYDIAYHHMQDASFMMVKSAKREENHFRHLRILHRDGNDKWVNSNIRCEIFTTTLDIPPHRRISNLEVNGEMISTGDRLRAREKTLR